jgi:AbrB family looped-hinge helix DNA binding protein
VKATIDEAGRVVIPKEISEAAGLRPGMSLEVRYDDGRIEIERQLSPRLVRRGRFLVAVADEPIAAPLEMIERTREAIWRERFPYVE